MMHADKTVLNSETIWPILKEWAKQYKKQCGNIPAEIIIVGGGSIVLNYEFRNATMDLDVVLKAASGAKDAILTVANKYNLPEDWMNNDFEFLSSYSRKIPEISCYYGTLNYGQIEIRTVRAEYLIAMKMQSGRTYGNDLSDIVGILYSEKEKNNEIPFSKIISAGEFLYEDNFKVSSSVMEYVKYCCLMSVEDLKKEYDKLVNSSEIIKSKIVEISNTENVSLTKKTAKELAEQIGLDLLQEADNLESEIEHE